MCFAKPKAIPPLGAAPAAPEKAPDPTDTANTVKASETAQDLVDKKTAGVDGFRRITTGLKM